MRERDRTKLENYLNILTRASKILSKPEKWAQGAQAIKQNNRTGKFVSCSIKDPKADCFCGEGAIRRAAYELQPQGWANRASNVIAWVDDTIIGTTHFDGIVDLNDKGFTGMLSCGGDLDEQRIAV